VCCDSGGRDRVGIFDLESFSHLTIILREFRSEVLRLLS
jgi:hypothetical protein